MLKIPTFTHLPKKYVIARNEAISEEGGQHVCNDCFTTAYFLRSSTDECLTWVCVCNANGRCKRQNMLSTRYKRAQEKTKQSRRKVGYMSAEIATPSADGSQRDSETPTFTHHLSNHVIARYEAISELCRSAVAQQRKQ